MHLSVLVLACLGLRSAATKASYAGPDYEALPLNTIFPGPWERNIRAPFNKSYIQPVKIFNYEGNLSGGETVLQDADSNGISWVIGPGGLITFEFAENIGGRYVRSHYRQKGCADISEESALKLMTRKTILSSSSPTLSLLSSPGVNVMLRATDKIEICHCPFRLNILGLIVLRQDI
jgi:hypothetical protein